MGLADYIIKEFLEQEKENLEVVNENSLIQYGDYEIEMESSSHYVGQGGAYFYFYNTKDHTMARILFERPEYTIDHKPNRQGYRNKHLVSSEKKMLMKILQDTPKKQSRDHRTFNTNWELLIYERDLVNEKSANEIDKYIGLPPEKWPKHLIPLTLPMPDYTQLPN